MNYFLKDCFSLTAVTFLGAASIGKRAFAGRSNLTVTLPESSGAEYGEEAFYGCKAFVLTSEKYTYTLSIPPSRHKTENDSCKEKIPRFSSAKTADEKWEILSSMKKTVLKHQLALFMVFAYDYKNAKTYVKRSIKKVMHTVIDRNDVQLLDDTLAYGFVTDKNFDAIFDYANGDTSRVRRSLLRGSRRICPVRASRISISFDIILPKSPAKIPRIFVQYRL